MSSYYVNRDDSQNPHKNHEVHKEGCRYMPFSKIYLGEFSDAVPAVAKARRDYYSDADGCATCCPEAHKE